jgi:hypothetical protein
MDQNGIQRIFHAAKQTEFWWNASEFLPNPYSADYSNFFSENGNHSCLPMYLAVHPYIIYFLHDLRSTGAGWVGALWACCTAGRTTRRTCARSTGCPREPPLNGGTSRGQIQRNGEQFSSLPSVLRIRSESGSVGGLLDPDPSIIKQR